MFFVFVLSFGCKYDKLDKLDVCDTNDVKYSTVIGPIIQANCATPGCHAGPSYTGDFSTYAGVKVRVDNGTFKSRVIDVHAMPPVNKLSDCDYKRLKAWYDAGALDN
jgi:hypothetical protein